MKRLVLSVSAFSSQGRTRLATLSLMGLLLCALLLCALPMAASSPGWLSPEWKHRTPVSVQYSGPQLTDYQVAVSLDIGFPFADAQPIGRDVRVTGPDGVTQVPFWIERWAAGSANLYVKVPAIPDGGTTLYLYYGNPAALSASDGRTVFEFFDNFKADVQAEPGPDKAKWKATSGTWRLVPGKQHDGRIGAVLRAATPEASLLYSSGYRGSDYVLEGYGRQIGGREWGLGVRVADPKDFYVAHLYDDMAGSNNLYVHAFADVSANTLGYSGVGEVRSNTWYKLTIKVHGSLIDVYKDGELKIHTADGSHAAGAIALWSPAGSMVEFDDISVRKYAETEPTIAVASSESSAGTASLLSEGTAQSKLAGRKGYATLNGELGPGANFTDTTSADFAAGTLDANTHVTQTNDGEVTLQLLADEFSGTTLSSEWLLIPAAQCCGSSATVSGGLLTLDGEHMSGQTPFHPGSFLEYYGTIGADQYHYAGFTGDRNFQAGPWALIGTGQSPSQLVAETSNGNNDPRNIPGDPGAPHLFRIEWLNSGAFDYYLDDVKVGSSSVQLTGNLWLGAGKYNFSHGGAPYLTLDFMHAGYYAGTYLSRIFTTAEAVTAAALSWTADTPSGTTLQMFVRSGNTAIPDGTWTAFTPVAASGDAISSGWRYVQYRANFNTSARGLIPVLNDVRIDYDLVDLTPPTVSVVTPAQGAVDAARDSDITVVFSEPMSVATINSATVTLRAFGGNSDVPATVSYSGMTAILHPSSRLASNTMYTATVSGVVTDLLGNALGGDYAWTFTTEETPDDWWRGAWKFRVPLGVTNADSTDLPLGYSVKATLDTAILIAAGQMLSDCSDLRAIYFDGTFFHELDRIVDQCGTVGTSVWFALQQLVPPGAQANSYHLYYGNSAPGIPPANGMNVFLFFEDWEHGADHWLNAGGLDAGAGGTMGESVVVTEDWVSPSHSQKFSMKKAGGDSFSGFIPVIAGTRYGVLVLGKSATPAYMPIGFDTYDGARNHLAQHFYWTNEWTLTPQWVQRAGTLITDSGSAFVRLSSEWWAEGPGTSPVYLDNLAFRRVVAIEPSVDAGQEETTLPAPAIGSVSATPDPVQVGSPAIISANVVAGTGTTINQVTLLVLSPETQSVPMAFNSLTGNWEVPFTPQQGGTYVYRVLAQASNMASAKSGPQTLSVIDTQKPQVALVSIVNPILEKNTQTIVVQVADNGTVNSVALDVGGTVYPMTPIGNQYSYSWRVTAVGTINYSVTATDTAGNVGVMTGTFVVQAREADVCTWKGCKVGAESWSIDDGVTSCKAEVEAAGFRGTYYYNGSGTQSWFAQYNAAGHEIASHTVGHPCTGNCCWPTCTQQNFTQCSYTPDQVIDYRQNQFEPNIAAIEDGTLVPVLTGAWPCGCNDPGRLAAAQPYFVATRGYYDSRYAAGNQSYGDTPWADNVNETTPPEWMNLWSAAYYMQSHIDRAVSEGKWAIIVSHGDCVGIDYMGLRTDQLWAAPVGEVSKYIKARDAASFASYSRAGQTITFDVAHNLGTFHRMKVDGSEFLPVVFDNPVTLKVHILDTDTVLGVNLDGNPVTSYAIQTVDGARYLLLDAAINTSRHVEVSLGLPAPTIEQVIDNSPVELGQTAQVEATVTMVSEGTIQSVLLRVIAPEAADYPMTTSDGTHFSVSPTSPFAPHMLGNYSYKVLASNNEGTTGQSSVRSLLVRDTTPPSWQNQTQTHDSIQPGDSNTLAAQAVDMGGLHLAILATDESGTWQEFNYTGNDSWWNHSWSHRRSITVSETVGIARPLQLVDVPISGVDYAGLTSCTRELRVVDSLGHEVTSQVYGEVVANGNVTCHLLFQASAEANASTSYYVYYGNAAAMPPSYTSDLDSTSASGKVTVRNSFFDLDLDSSGGGGVISRLRLPQGNNTDLPLAPQSDHYWGFHQVCSSLDGNITGKNEMCSSGGSGVPPASGLAFTTTMDGPLAKEYGFTSVKGNDTYSITFRFLANTPFYEYKLSRTGAGLVMNNFDYPPFCPPAQAGGSCAPFNIGQDVNGSPATWFNLYSAGADQLRIASFTAVDEGLIDGYNNGVTTLGGTAFNIPSASGLALYVSTGTSQAETQAVLALIAAPALSVNLGTAEDAPSGQYGSPMDLRGATDLRTTAFNWQNASIPAGQSIQWRIKYCDLSENCVQTGVMSFKVGKQEQEITFGALGNKAYGDAPFAVSATASSGLAVSFSVGGSDSCTVAGDMVTITGAGNCTVTAHQAGDATYNAAPDVAQSFTIAKATASIQLSNLSQSYDGTAKAAAASTTPSGLGVSLTYDGATTAPSGAGSYAVDAVIQENNYQGSATGTLVIARALASVTPNAAGKVYGTSDPVLSGTLSGFFVADNVTAAYSRTAGETVAGSPYTISATLSPGGVLGNYNISYNTAQFSISPADPLIVWGTPADIEEGTALSEVQLNASSPVAGTFSYNPGAGTVLGVGSHPLTATLHSTDTNYVDGKTATVTINVLPGLARIVAPAKGTTLGGSTVTFSWTQQSGATSYQLWLGRSAGSHDLGVIGTTQLSGTVTTLPTDGSQIYVTLYGYAGGKWTVEDTASYTAATLVQAQILSPAKGATLTGSTATFTWSAETGATSYQLWLGRSAGTHDLAVVGTTQLSGTVTTLPTDGSTIYATLNGYAGGKWTVQDTASYTALNLVKAAIQSPAEGATLAGSTVTFSWTAETGATSYQLWLGRTAGAHDLAVVGTAQLSATATGLPIDGSPVYATLNGYAGGKWTVQDSKSYTAASLNKATIISPEKGSTLTGSKVTFSWTAETGATSYQLWLGRTAGAHDLAVVGTTQLSGTATTLPTDGSPVYVTLYGYTAGGWAVQDTATYTAFH